MIANEKEHQFRRGGYKDKGQPLFKPHPAFKDVFRQSANADARVQVRAASAAFIASPVTLRVGFSLLTKLVQEIICDSCPQ